MPRALPPLTWFRSFEASARTLNFTAAADELGLTQSAISQQVRSLELRLGVALFVRKPRGLILTDEGRTLQPKVGASLEQLARATAEFETGPTDGLLTVAASVSVVRWIIAPRIAEFTQLHSGLRIRLLGMIWPDEFKAALADVEIRFGSERQVARGATRLGPDTLVAVAATPLIGPLTAQTLIEPVGMSEGWRDWAQESGVADLPEPALFVDSHGAALDLASGGAGVALTSSLLAARALAQGDLVQVHDATIPSVQGYHLAVTASSDAAKAFGDWVTDCVRHPTVSALG